MSETGDYCLIYSFTQSIRKFTICRLMNVYYGRLKEYTVVEQQIFRGGGGIPQFGIIKTADRLLAKS